MRFSAFRRVLARFVPAALVVFASVIALITIAEPHGLSSAALGLAGLELSMLSAGYLIALATVRSRRGEISGSVRSHTVAGFAAPLALLALSPFTQGTNLPGIIALSVGTGVLVGFAHWAATARAPRPPRPTLEELEAAADAELARLDSLPGSRPDVLPIARPEKIPVKGPKLAAVRSR